MWMTFYRKNKKNPIKYSPALLEISLSGLCNFFVFQNVIYIIILQLLVHFSIITYNI